MLPANSLKLSKLSISDTSPTFENLQGHLMIGSYKPMEAMPARLEVAECIVRRFYPSTLSMRNIEKRLVFDELGNISGVATLQWPVQEFDSLLHFWTLKLLVPTIHRAVTYMRNFNEWPLFPTIKPPIEITEERLTQIIEMLEAMDGPMAFFTHLISGLLLDNQVPVYMDKDNLAYREKRQHDAISFYIKAAEDGGIKRIVDCLLWKMQETSQFDSVLNRLSTLNLIPPPGYTPAVKNDQTPQVASRKIFLGDRHGLFAKLASKHQKQFEDDSHSIRVIPA